MTWEELITVFKANNIIIDRFVGDFAFLSNFSNAEVELHNMKFPTVEHAFQAAKTTDKSEREAIQRCEIPGRAKRMGRRVTLRLDWEDIKILVMNDLLIQKFKNPELKQKLIDTRPLKLVEGNNWHDNFWGDCGCGKCINNPGKNHLGRLLMKIREEI